MWSANSGPAFHLNVSYSLNQFPGLEGMMMIPCRGEDQMGQCDSHVAQSVGLETTPTRRGCTSYALALCPQLTWRLLAGSGGDSLGHRGQQTLPHHSAPSTVSPWAEKLGRAFLPVFLNRTILLCFPANALSRLHESQGLLSPSLSLLVERKLRGEYAVDLYLMCRASRNTFYIPANLLVLSYLSHIYSSLAYVFPNLILSCMCVVNNLKLFLEQGRVKLKK